MSSRSTVIVALPDSSLNSVRYIPVELRHVGTFSSHMNKPQAIHLRQQQSTVNEIPVDLMEPHPDLSQLGTPRHTQTP
jgi:hypothetical protein